MGGQHGISPLWSVYLPYCDCGTTPRMTELPHEGVWSRLGASGLHGIGVFAIRPIPASTNVFASDGAAIVWVDAAEISALSPDSPLRRLYHDFAIRRGAQLGCPANFNMLSVGWYVNEPALGDVANLTIAADYAMIACRDIAEGEELTISYDTFSMS